MTNNILSVGACFKCGKTSTAPCSDLHCVHPPTGISEKRVDPSRPMGCICPPTSEQTCMNPLCPRQNHIGKAK